MTRGGQCSSQIPLRLKFKHAWSQGRGGHTHTAGVRLQHSPPPFPGAPPRAAPPSPERTRQSECLGPVQPAAHCSWQQSVGFVPLQRGQPWQMLLVTEGGGQSDTVGTETLMTPPQRGCGGPQDEELGGRSIPRAGIWWGGGGTGVGIWVQVEAVGQGSVGVSGEPQGPDLGV